MATDVIMIVTSARSSGHSFIFVRQEHATEVGDALDLLNKYDLVLFTPTTIAIDQAAAPSDAEEIADNLGWVYIEGDGGVWVPGTDPKIEFLAASPKLMARAQLQWWHLDAPNVNFDLGNVGSITSPRKTVFVVVPAVTLTNADWIYLGTSPNDYNEALRGFALLTRGFVVHRWSAGGLIVEPIDTDPTISDVDGVAAAFGWVVTPVESFPFLPGEAKLGNAALSQRVKLLTPGPTKKVVALADEPIINGPVSLAWTPVSWAN